MESTSQASNLDCPPFEGGASTYWARRGRTAPGPTYLKVATLRVAGYLGAAAVVALSGNRIWGHFFPGI